MQCVEELGPEALFDLDEIEALPSFDAPDIVPDFPAVAFGFAETVTTSATTCTVSVTLVSENPYDGVFGYAQSPLGLCADSRYNDRMASISGAEALLESQHGALFNFFARFLTGVLRRGVQTAYQGEQSGLSPGTAYGLGAAQGVSESAFASATVGLAGIAGGELLGSLPALIPAAAGTVGAGGANIVFQSQHAARHLQGTGLSPTAVEAAVRSQVSAAVSAASATGNFWGRVAVGGQTIEYRAYTLANGTINVGTYYPVQQ